MSIESLNPILTAFVIIGSLVNVLWFKNKFENKMEGNECSLKKSQILLSLFLEHISVPCLIVCVLIMMKFMEINKDFLISIVSVFFVVVAVFSVVVLIFADVEQIRLNKLQNIKKGIKFDNEALIYDIPENELMVVQADELWIIDEIKLQVLKIVQILYSIAMLAGLALSLL